MTSSSDFPRLNQQNHRVTSPASLDYNCIAWAAGDIDHWWQPGIYWPIDMPASEYGLGVLQRLFESMGYETCLDEQPESGYEKVALFADDFYYTHAARQLPNGRWTSKLGSAEDIEHESSNDIAGGLYGEVKLFLRRAVGSGG